MQILKGKKDRQPDINQYADMKHSHVQEIKLEKWVEQAKANKLAYEASKSENAQQDWINSKNEMINDFINTYPPDFAREKVPELTSLIEDKFYWNKEALLILVEDAPRWSHFTRIIEREVLEWYGWDGVSDWIEALDAAKQKIKDLVNNPDGENN